MSNAIYTQKKIVQVLNREGWVLDVIERMPKMVPDGQGAKVEAVQYDSDWYPLVFESRPDGDRYTISLSRRMPSARELREREERRLRDKAGAHVSELMPTMRNFAAHFSWPSIDVKQDDTLTNNVNVWAKGKFFASLYLDPRTGTWSIVNAPAGTAFTDWRDAIRAIVVAADWR